MSVESLTGFLQAPNLSRDGTRVAIERTDAAGTDVYIIDLARGTNTRVTVTPGSHIRPVFSPDGRKIAFGRGGKVFLIAASGLGTEEPISEGEPTDWSPDGKVISVLGQGALDGGLWGVPVAGDRNDFRSPGSAISACGAGGFHQTDVGSAHEANISGPYQVRPAVSADRGSVALSAGGGGSPLWNASGKELFYYSPDRRIMAVDVTLGSAFVAGRAHALFDVSGDILNGRFIVSNDGQRFLLPLIPLTSTQQPITMLLNWTATLKK